MVIKIGISKEEAEERAKKIYDNYPKIKKYQHYVRTLLNRGK